MPLLHSEIIISSHREWPEQKACRRNRYNTAMKTTLHCNDEVIKIPQRYFLSLIAVFSAFSISSFAFLKIGSEMHCRRDGRENGSKFISLCSSEDKEIFE